MTFREFLNFREYGTAATATGLNAAGRAGQSLAASAVKPQTGAVSPTGAGSLEDQTPGNPKVLPKYGGNPSSKTQVKPEGQPDWKRQASPMSPGVQPLTNPEPSAFALIPKKAAPITPMQGPQAPKIPPPKH